jgi:AcrR family transcriptional regulator
MLPFYIHEDDPPAKREILRAAMKLFSRHGLAATSIRDIADESGYTNPALYKHFASKEELALYLFEACHRRLWAKCHAALAGAGSFEAKVEAYVGQVLESVDEDPEAMAFLSDSARVLWPLAGSTVRRQTIIDLARSLVAAAPRARRRRAPINVDVAAACVQGTLAELARMIQVGAVPGPAVRWKADVTALIRRIAAP